MMEVVSTKTWRFGNDKTKLVIVLENADAPVQEQQGAWRTDRHEYLSKL